jgi:hypothetical protein
MAVQHDSEIESWRRQWQTGDAIPQDLEDRVQRAVRSRRIGLAVALLVTFVFGAGVPTWAVVSRRTDVVVLAAAVWVFIALNWTVSWRLGRGLEKPVATTTAAFIDYSILLCERRRRAIAAASVLYAGMLTFNLAWQYQASAVPPGLWAYFTSTRMVVVAVVTVLLGIVAVWRRRTLAREIRNLTEMRRQLAQGGQPKT